MNTAGARPAGPSAVMAPIDLLGWLLELGITLTVEGDMLKVRGPRGGLAHVRTMILANKAGLLAYLTQSAAVPASLAPALAGSQGSNIYAFDLETVNGEPISLQWSGPEGIELHRVTRATALSTLGDLLRRHGTPRGVNYLFAHNLGFDLGVCLIDYLADIWETPTKRRRPSVVAHNMIIEPSIYDRKVKSATIRMSGCDWSLVDTTSFFNMKLAEAAERLNLPVKKHPVPPYLGKRYPTDAEWPAFEGYAKADAEATRHLGLLIARAHAEFSLPLTVSIAQMAESVFTRVHKAVIPSCERVQDAGEFIAACRESYHGGLNVLAAAPGVYENVTELDISSAYPHAMVSLPPLTHGAWRRVQGYQPEQVAAIYRVRGQVRGWCPYGIFYGKPGTRGRPNKIHEGAFDLWVSGYELQAALSEIDDGYEITDGYVWEPAPGAVNPFIPYVEEFYRRKQQTPKSEPMREVYKLLLNALYGKLNQEGSAVHNVFWASMVTGHTRARLHGLEHQYEALHSSTDSIITQRPFTPEPEGLGAIEVKARGRWLVLVRWNLYVLLDDERRVVAYKRHAFNATADVLLDLLRTGGDTYIERNHMTTPLEALRSKKGLQPFVFGDRERHLRLPPATAAKLKRELAAAGL